jgi:predicted membrane channel-forming protein YqfA (hemolysin III family)
MVSTRQQPVDPQRLRARIRLGSRIVSQLVVYSQRDSQHLFHLVPAVIFLLGGWYVSQYLAGRYPRVTSTDLVTFSFFMLTATICYAFSALYHILMNHSYTVDHFCHRLDMLGIGIFIVGDIVLGV